jgi:hypothetical protein
MPELTVSCLIFCPADLPRLPCRLAAGAADQPLLRAAIGALLANDHAAR